MASRKVPPITRTRDSQGTVRTGAQTYTRVGAWAKNYRPTGKMGEAVRKAASKKSAKSGKGGGG